MQHSNLKVTGLFLLSFLFAPIHAGSTPLKVDRQASSIKIDVKATVGSFVGELLRYKLKIEINEAAQIIQSATLNFDFEYLNTGEEKRDRHMKDWLDYDTLPTAEFKLTALDASGEQTMAKGSITIHGIKKDISFPIEITQEDGRWIIDGRVHLNYMDFDLKKIRMALMITVNPEFDVILHIEAEKAPAK